MKPNSKTIQLVLGLIISLIGIIVLLSWIIKPDTPVEAGHITMKINSAINMILLGFAIALLTKKKYSNAVRYLVLIMTLIVLVITILTLLEYFFNIDYGMDQFFIKDVSTTLTPGRMSPVTAFCFINSSIAILLSGQRKSLHLRKPIIAALATTINIVSTVIIGSYILNYLFNLELLSYINTGLYTAIAFGLIGCSLLLFLYSEGDFIWALDTPITYGGIIALILILLISFGYSNFTKKVIRSNQALLVTQQVLQDSSNIAIALELFANNALDPSLNANERVKNQTQDEKTLLNYLNKIDADITDNTEPQRLLNRLKKITSEWMNLNDKEQSTHLKELSTILLQLQQVEEKILGQQKAEQARLANEALLLSPFGVILSISMFLIGFFIFNATIVIRKKVHSAQNRLADIVKSSNDGIIGQNLDGIINTWNIGAEQIYGYTAAEVIGQPVQILFPPDKFQEEIEVVDKVRRGERINHLETLRKKKDGKLINVYINISPIKNEKNQIIGISKIVHDITEKKQLEAQLRQSQKMGAIGQLTGGVAHDFNNILGIILGNLDLLERSVSNNEALLKRVQNALKAATRGADLTKRLLAFSRQQQLNPTPTDLADSVNNIVEMAVRILGPDIKIRTNLCNDLPPVLIDTAELESALLNLCVNARDAMPKGGEIIINTKLIELDQTYISVQTHEIVQGLYACISVTDTGEGMSKETLERAFEPFFTTKARGKGTGMGLSMVYGFVKQSGGNVKIYSEQGIGTTISLYLPCDPNLKPKANKEFHLTLEKAHGTVLVVDDEPDLLEIASVYLQEMGFDIVGATDGVTALELFKKTPDIRLLVTDVIMPGGINGLELGRRVQKIKPNICVVYTSGFPEGIAGNKGNKVDTILINKPYDRSVFVRTIYQALKDKAH